MTTQRRNGHERRDGDDRRAEPLWFKLDVVFREDPLVDELGHECGAGGPLVWVCLIAAAKAQEKLHARRGTVEIGWRAIARAGYYDSADEARKVVDTAVELGLLEVVEDGRFEVTVFLPNYARKQAIPSMDPDAVRKREARAAARTDAPPDTDDVQPCPAVSGRVPARPTDREGEREGEKEEEGARAPSPGEIIGPYAVLDRVLPVLEESGLAVEPRSILSLIEAFPDEDHLAAAHCVAALKAAGHNRSHHSTSIFRHELDKAKTQRLRNERDTTPRSRGPAPPPAKPWSGALRHAMEGVNVDR